MHYEEVDYGGFRQLNFEFNGHKGIVVFPKGDIAAVNRKWVWRAEFFGQYDRVDRMMLERGYMLLHYSISDMYGCPEAIELMKKFYDFVVKEFKLCSKTVIIGLSRGGLYASNFALTYPETVSALFLYAAVMDIKSWPRKAYEDTSLWEGCKKCYGLTEETYKEYHNSPADRLDEFVSNKFPVFVMTGDKDTSVKFEENTKLLIDRYVKENMPLQYIVLKDEKSHPYDLEDVTPICDFLCKYYKI